MKRSDPKRCRIETVFPDRVKDLPGFGERPRRERMTEARIFDEKKFAAGDEANRIRHVVRHLRQRVVDDKQSGRRIFVPFPSPLG